MINRVKYYRLITAIILMVTTLCACRKELCYNHFHGGSLTLLLKYKLDWKSIESINVDPDWEFDFDKLIPAEPEGVRLECSPISKSAYPRYYNLPKEGGVLELSPDSYNFLLYNNDTERIYISGTGENTIATTGTKTRESYNTKYPNERTASTPDMLFGSFEREFIIEPTEAYEKKVVELTKELTPRVYTYVIRYEILEGIEHVLEARGTLSGMAASINIASGATGDETVTFLYDCYIQNRGIEATIQTFGIPNSVESKANGESVITTSAFTNHKVSLEIFYKNGNTKRYEFDISDMLHRQPRGGVIYFKDIKLNPNEHDDSTGGFNTEVNDWGKDVEIPVPII